MSVVSNIIREHEGQTRWFVQVDVPDPNAHSGDRIVEFVFLSRIEADRFAALLEQAVTMIVI
jgi:hypothetical protein